MAQRRRGLAFAGKPAPAPGRQDLHCWVFDAFRLDLRDERLWRGPDVLPLHPKTFAVLCCLVTQAGRLVTKDALLEAIWPETVVSEAVLQVAIRELRRALGEQARTPRFIGTVHGRGYRFIAPVQAPVSPDESAGSETLRSAPHRRFRRPPHFVGREAELVQMLQAHCHLGLGRLYGQIGRGEQAHTTLATAIDLYRSMDMTLWLPQAEAALAAVCANDKSRAAAE